MSSGFQGKTNPSANTWTLLYTVPSAKIASFSVNAVNYGTTSSGVDIAISTSATSGGIAVSEYIEFNAPLPSVGSTLERTGLVTDDVNGKYVWVRASNSTTSFQAYGYEE